MSFKILSTAVIATIGISPGICAGADDVASGSPFVNDKYTIWLGGFFPNLDSNIRMDSDMGTLGDGLDFEETLGLEDAKSVLFGGFRWRPSFRHMVEFEFIRLDRAGQVSGITENFDIGDYEVRAGGRIDTVFDVAISRFTYGYSAIATETSSLYLKAGLHIASFDAVLKLSGAVFIDGIPINDPSTVVEEAAGLNAPLPHIGVSYGRAISPRVAFRTQALLFAIKFNNYKGTLLDFGADVQFRPWQAFGLGAGLRYFRTTVEDDSGTGLRGKFSYEYVGPVVYGTWSF
jgi:hypothetical protein